MTLKVIIYHSSFLSFLRRIMPFGVFCGGAKVTILLKFSVLTSLLNVACELSQTMSKTEFPKITSVSEVRNICRKSTKQGLAFDYIARPVTVA